MTDDHDAPALPAVDPAAAEMDLADAYSPELLASLLADGDDDLAAWTIRHALDAASRIEVYDGLVADAMRLVGERWATGRWSVAEEHLASQTLMRALERVRPPLGPDGRVGPLVVLAGAAGEDHVIGLVCLDHVLSERGWMVANLGANLPPEDLGTFIGRNDAGLVALTASHPARLEAVEAAVKAIRDATTDHIPVMLGGRLAERPDRTADLGLGWVGTTLAGAATYAATILADRQAADA